MKNKLLLMIKICLIISGVVFICLSIFTEQKNNTYFYQFLFVFFQSFFVILDLEI